MSPEARVRSLDPLQVASQTIFSQKLIHLLSADGPVAITLSFEVDRVHEEEFELMRTVR